MNDPRWHVNTNYLKKLGISLTIMVVFAIMGYYMVVPQKTRQVAFQNKEAEGLTEGQQLKWSITQQFNIRQTNESLLIDVPHIAELCASNTFVQFIFRAYEVTSAGENPSITYSLSCQVMTEAHATQTELFFSDLADIHKTKEKTLDRNGIKTNLRSHLLYSDEPLPAAWMLGSIQVQGQNGFVINQFEIQKVFSQNFQFRLE